MHTSAHIPVFWYSCSVQPAHLEAGVHARVDGFGTTFSSSPLPTSPHNEGAVDRTCSTGLAAAAEDLGELLARQSRTHCSLDGYTWHARTHAFQGSEFGQKVW